jgi:hypothetical protein
MEYVVTAGPKRLVGVRFAPGGDAMYVVDIGAIAVPPSPTPSPHPFVNTGVIWKISRSGAPSGGGPTNLSPIPGRAGKHETSRPATAGGG